jgi:hypothetical protein
LASTADSEIFCSTSIPSKTLTEDGVLIGQRRLIREEDEELIAGAVWLARDQDGGHRPAGERRGPRLGLHHVLSACAVLRALGRILRERVASLHHPVPHHRVKRRAVVAPFLRDFREIRHLVRRRLGRQIDDERAERGFNDGLLRSCLS